MDEIKHHIGQEINYINQTYKLVEGDNCEDCVFDEKPDCHNMPECDHHEGHYVLVTEHVIPKEDSRYFKLLIKRSVDSCQEIRYGVMEITTEISNGNLEIKLSEGGKKLPLICRKSDGAVMGEIIIDN